MGIRRLLFESVVVIAVMTCLVVVVNSFQIHQNAYKHFVRLQEQYFDATYDIYKDAIVGDLLMGDKQITAALLQEIASHRGVGLSLSYKEINIHEGGARINVQPSKSYEIGLGDGNNAIFTLYPASQLKVPWFFNELGVPLFLEILVLGFGFIYLWWRFRKKLLVPLADLASYLKPGQMDNYVSKPEAVIEVKELSDTLKLMNAEIQKRAFFEAEAKAAKQVGHDIRSPLACLTLLLSQISVLPEEQRTLMRSAIQRITDIANSLYSKGQGTSKGELKTRKVESFMISSLVESLVSEKRMQLREKENIHVNLNIERSYGLFAEVDLVEFKRALSNIINNSVEAFDNKPHKIHIVVEKIQDWVQITVQDDGKGIPREILEKIGRYGVSYGKEAAAHSGFGLGLYHAINTIKSFGGTFSINSKENQGAEVTVRLPQSEIPFWFTKELELKQVEKVVVLDDDQSIHNLWRDKFCRSQRKDIKLLFFSCNSQFREYCLKELKTERAKVLFLIDFELLNQSYTGLDLIEEFGLAKQSVLVTSYYEDPNIRERARKIGVRMIPKGIAAFVPIV